jgi:hypothetical protein
MNLNQYRVAQLASRSDAIAPLDCSKLACFLFVAPVEPWPGTRLQTLGTGPPRACGTPFVGYPTNTQN